jgi:hydrogenase maturation protein HypF
MNPSCIARQLDIHGVVQGVGFRPFLFSLAKEHRIFGEVANTAQGVQARVEGLPGDLERFVADIMTRLPRLARVDRIDTAPVPVRGMEGFSILASRAASSRATLISPDVCVCDDCLAEMRNPDNRRYGYPFINCTHCGPRFTIINDIPYDRPFTSMKAFDMCPDCRAEYDNPADRRFHAQPNACPECGPHVFLTDNQGKRIAGPDSAVRRAAGLLNQGGILAVKGLGGFHLAVDAANDRAVRRLRERKQRPHKPLALMARSAAVLEDHVRLSDQEKKLLQSYHRPIVLAEKQGRHAGTERSPDLNPDLSEDLLPDMLPDVSSGLPSGLPWGLSVALSPALAPRNTCLGIMLPYTPLHYLLLDTGPQILVMTSGNRAGEPLSVDNQDALDAFSHIADYFLLHDRDIYFRADDSIVRIQAKQPRFIRRSRGYAPLPVPLNRSLPPVLGCGAGLKNTICLTRENQAFLSQHIGDMENQPTFEFYTETIGHFTRILDITPRAVAHDLHPGYMSTAFAQQYAGTPGSMGVSDNGASGSGEGGMPGILCIGVQHHHAHAVSCMAENFVDGPVVAVTLDGTGYGTDGCIWGGEILLADCSDFQRKACLAYVPMPGGDKAVLEPWRMAAAVLYTAFGKAFVDLDIPWIRQMDKQKLNFLCRMMDRKINSPLTSSCGRLFDAVASLLGIRHVISHESQAAMELEAEAEKADDRTTSPEPYPFRLAPAPAPAEAPGPDSLDYIIDLMPCVREIAADLTGQVPVPSISRRFHQTVVAAFAGAAEKIACTAGLSKVVLSGGVFYNDIVLTGMIQALEAKGLTVFTHTLVPTGDGGISLGQVVVAGTRMTPDRQKMLH